MKGKMHPLPFNRNYDMLYSIENKKNRLKEGLLVLRLLRCMESPSFLLVYVKI